MTVDDIGPFRDILTQLRMALKDHPWKDRMTIRILNEGFDTKRASIQIDIERVQV